MRQVTHGPNEDSGPRWSPDGQTLTFLSDRGTAGSAQLYALETGELGEARLLVEAPGVVEHHEWSPDGSRILLLVAGHGAEQTDALGSGTLGPEAELRIGSRWSNRARARAIGAARSTCSSRPAARWRGLARRAERLGGDLVRRSRRRRDRLRGRRRGCLVQRRADPDRPGCAQCAPLRRSEVQLGWACGSPAGTYVR